MHRRAFRFPVGISALLLAFVLPRPASAQTGNIPSQGRAIGEEYHIEVSGGLWRPSLRGIISSEQFGIAGSDIDFLKDLGFKTVRFSDGRLVLRPGRKHRFRVQYTPISYSAESKLSREVVFNGFKYPVNVPIQSTFDWKVWRFGYEYDFFYTNRGFIGLLVEGRYTEMKASLKSPLSDEFTSAKVPLPAFGLVGRAYPVKNVSITAEVSGFKLPHFDEQYDANYVDIDIYGTVNFTRFLGVQGGWRRMNTYLRVETDKGDFRFNGIWFGGAIRY